MERIEPFVRASTYALFQRAFAHCQAVLKRSEEYFAQYSEKEGVDASKVCFVVAGSFGRQEALEASDFDLLPIVDDDALYAHLSDEPKNLALRKGLQEALGGLDVSMGRSVTAVAKLADLVDPSKIGGNGDNRDALSRRILVLTESAQAGGTLKLPDVRRRILTAYTQRTAGRHPLAFCNDLARYYRTLCIDYKAKVDTATDSDWAEKNVKLRHSRKFWYFATALATASIAEMSHPDKPQFVEGLLSALSLPPVLRLFDAAGIRCRPAAGRLLDQYAWYLDFMSDPERRGELKTVTHKERYSVSSNPYAVLQWNSKVLHSSIMSVLEQVDRGIYDRTIEWFLL
jgi:hypothetical protein